jgi:hypothetical protein
MGVFVTPNWISITSMVVFPSHLYPGPGVDAVASPAPAPPGRSAASMRRRQGGAPRDLWQGYPLV